MSETVDEHMVEYSSLSRDRANIGLSVFCSINFVRCR